MKTGKYISTGKTDPLLLTFDTLRNKNKKSCTSCKLCRCCRVYARRCGLGQYQENQCQRRRKSQPLIPAPISLGSCQRTRTWRHSRLTPATFARWLLTGGVCFNLTSSVKREPYLRIRDGEVGFGASTGFHFQLLWFQINLCCILRRWNSYFENNKTSRYF